MLSKDKPSVEPKGSWGAFASPRQCCAGVRTGRAWMSHGPWHGASILRADHHNLGRRLDKLSSIEASTLGRPQKITSLIATEMNVNSQPALPGSYSRI